MVATKITIDDIDEIPKQVLELVRKVKEGHRNCVALTKAKKVPKRLDSALPASVSAQSEKNKIKYLKELYRKRVIRYKHELKRKFNVEIILG